MPSVKKVPPIGTINKHKSEQLRNRVPKRTCLQRCAGVRARGGNRLANQVSNEEILRGSTPLCLAERLAEIFSLFRIFGYVFDFVVPPNGT